MQKTHQLYWENGITLDYTHDCLLDQHLHVGLSFISSRFGTALNSNALKQDHYMLYGAWVFRPDESLQPVVRLNTGYFIADYESDLFNDLDNTSLLLSAETGFIVNAYKQLDLLLMLGYNFITGDGTSGAGTLFPLFYYLSVSWTLKGGAR
ncbi:MAG: hypothetical protein U5R06_23095 [candidate division KSB1 bacterium]|nr:hypothetical protein [candidate division KSB1 bacterium]